MSDDLANNTCPAGQVYVVEDGTTSFFVCYKPSTGQIYHITNPNQCTFGTLLFFIDLRGSISKYACTEDNLNLVQCDFFPAGPHNEIREIGPIPNTSGGFIDCTWQWVFDGNNSPTQSCLNDSSNADIELALEALPGINDVTVTGGPIAGTVDAPIRIEFVGVDAQTDIIPTISILAQGSTINQDDITVVDGSPSGPEVSYVVPGGTVQIFQATGATDPDNPATYGPDVTGGPQPVNPTTGLFTSAILLDGNYVVCADGPTAVSPSCEIVTVAGVAQTILNLVDMPGTITAAIVSAGTNEVQSYNDFFPFGGQVSGGTYTITFDGSTTGALAFDADAATVEAALEALASVAGDNVTVTGGPPNGAGAAMVIEFINALGNQNVPVITIDNSSLTGAGLVGYFPQTDVEGAGATQTLTADRRVSGGTFTLAFGADTTVPIAWNADAATVEAALNALPSINATGNVVVAGELVTNAPLQVHMDVFFTNVPGADVTPLVVDNTLLE
jgi:hypothetical protein